MNFQILLAIFFAVNTSASVYRRIITKDSPNVDDISYHQTGPESGAAMNN